MTLEDIPLVIPALRAQQSVLEFAFETSAIPTTSPFSACMKYVYDTISPRVRRAVVDSEGALQNLVSVRPINRYPSQEYLYFIV